MNLYFHSPLDIVDRQNLKTSIEHQGVLEPVWITRDSVIISGHQRWEISSELGKEQIPTRTVDAPEEEIEILIVAANTDRRQEEKDLMRKARQAEVLCRRAGISRGGDRTAKGLLDRLNQEDIAKSFGVDVRTLRRLLKLLCLIEPIQALVSSNDLGLYAGNALASLTEEEQQKAYHMLISYEEPLTLKLVKEVCQKVLGVQEEIEIEEGDKVKAKKNDSDTFDKIEQKLLKIGEKMTADEKQEMSIRLRELADRIVTVM